MSEQVTVTKTIAVGSNKAWLAISGIGGLDRWFPIIADCRVQGAGVGAQRIMILVDGSEIKDDVLEINHADRRFRYHRIQAPWPVSNYMGAVTVSDADQGAAVITWMVTFDVAEQDRADMAALVTQALSDGIDGMERDLQAQP